MENAFETNGFKAVSIPFTSIGVEVEGVKGVYLTSLIPQGADKMTSSENTVQVQFLDSVGSAKDGYVYTYHKGDTINRFKTDGWYRGNNIIKADVNDVFIPQDEGIFAYSKVAGMSFVPSGEVFLDSKQVDLETDGYRLISNPYATSLMLTDIIPLGADKMTSSENTVTLQLLNASGGTKDGYIYTYHKGDTINRFKTDGWYRGNNIIKADENDLEILAGQSFFVYGKVAGLKLQIVTPFEDAE